MIILRSYNIGQQSTKVKLASHQIDPPPLLLAKTEEKNSTQRFLFPYQFLICLTSSWKNRVKKPPGGNSKQTFFLRMNVFLKKKCMILPKMKCKIFYLKFTPGSALLQQPLTGMKTQYLMLQ